MVSFRFYQHCILWVITDIEAEIGLLGAITPAMTFIVSPLWGVLADLTGNICELDAIVFSHNSFVCRVP